MNRTGSKILHGLLLATSGLVGSTVIASTAAMAGGPTGGHVAVGSATIINPSPTQTVINQSSKKALINWNSFSVSSGSSVQFNQPNSKSLTVNRVTGADASVINGSLQANGNVWLLNANGVLFGKGSQINVGSLIATTSDLSDDDFKNGNYTFKPSANSDASVVNKGTITVSQGGSVVLSAPQVSNEGIIQANLGTVVLGGAKAFTVDITGDNLLTYQITEPVGDAPKSANGSVAKALVSNSGTIMAAGGHVMMTARAARNVEDNVINNTGMVEATTVSAHNGVIDLDAGPDGTVNDSGSLKATGAAPGQTGGSVNVTGGTVNIADGAKIDASGQAGGGTVQIGGGLHGQGTLSHAQTTNVGNATISADATGKGNGGTVAIWSDGTTSFAGTVTARGGSQGGNGGQVETSGHNLGVAASANVDTSAPLGLTGDWLLDPATINIVSNVTGNNTATSLPGNGTLSVGSDPGQTDYVTTSTISSALASTNVTLEATSLINVDAALSYTSNHTLSLLSEGNINVNASIQNSGTGSVNLVGGWDGTTTDFSNSFASSAYGAANTSIVIYGSNIGVGSASGKTLIAGNSVQVFAANGYAQIGYHGAGSGDIQVLTKGLLSMSGTAGDANTVAQIGNGGDISGNVGGNIAINALNTQLTGNGGVVAIGNIGNDSSSSQSGDIQVTTGGLTLTADQNQGASVVQIGNWSATGTGGSASGNITITASGNVEMDAYGDNSRVVIGNSGGFTDSTASGDISISASSVYLNAVDNYGFAQARIGNRGYYSASGNIGITTTNANGTIALTANGTDLASIGQGVGTSAATSTGNLTVSSAGTLSVTAHDSGQARISNGNAANSTINVTADKSLSMTVDGTAGIADDGTPAPGMAWIGNFGNSAAANVGGNITVSSTNGSITLLGQQDGALVSIGNMGGATTTSGRVVVSALNASSGIVSLVANGSTVSANGTSYSTSVRIGNSSPTGNVSGSTVVNASQLTIEASATNATAMIGLLGENSSGSQSGNITVNVTQGMDVTASGDFSVAQVGNWSDVTTSGGATGTINITVGTDFLLSATGDGSRATVGHGGPLFRSQGQTGGKITLTAGTIDVIASDSAADGAQASIGSRGLGQIVGNITLKTTSGDFTLTATDGDLAAVGNRGSLSTSSSSGSITVVSAAGVNILANDTGESRISGGFASNSNISVTAAGDILLEVSGDPNGALVGQAHIGSFGNGVVNAGGNIAVTSSSGGITLEAEENGSQVYIGNAGGLNSTSGNIVVTASNSAAGDIQLYADGDSSLVQIGNTSPSGAISGNVTLTAGHNLIVDASANGTVAQIGNGSSSEDGFTGGNITGNIILTVNGDLDLTAEQYDSIAQIGNGDPNAYRSGNVSGDISIKTLGYTDINSEGDGSGWIGNTADGESSFIETGNVTLITQGGSLYGDYFVDDLGTAVGTGGNVFVGFTGANGTYNFDGLGEYESANTFTWAAAASVDVSLDTQNSGSGNINLIAGWDGHTTNLSSLTNSGVYGNNNGVVTIDGYVFPAVVGSKSGKTTVLGYDVDVVAMTGGEGFAQIGYNDSGATGAIDVRAVHDISVLGGDGSSGDCTECEPTATYAQIGNGGAFVTGAEGGNINVKAGGNITVTGGQGTFNYAQIGNGGDAGNPGNGTSSDTGNIAVTAGGFITLTGGIDYAQIGNGGWGSNGSSGNIAVVASGNITLNGAANSPWGYVQIGNGGQSSLGTTSGNISVTANGTLKLVGGNDGMYAQIGNGGDENSSQGKSSGNITVTAGNLTLVGASSLSGNSEGYAVIGNSAVYNSSVSGSGTASGNIAISVANATTFQSTDGEGDVWIGNAAINGTETGALTLITGTFDDSADNNDDVNQFILSDIGGGNVTLGTTNASVTNTIGGFSYNSSNALTILLAGNAIVDKSIQNAGSGNVTIVAGWNTAISPSAVLSTSNSYGVGGKTLTIGGSSAAGAVSVGSKSGTTNILTGSLIVSSNHGNAQLGYNGAGTGAINVKALGNVTVQAEANSTVALLGNGGYGLTGAIKGDISIIAGGNVTVRTDASSAIADIGVIGGDGSSQSGNITITAGGQVGVIAQNSTSNAQIGNQQAGATTPSQRGNASGNIAITSGSVLISATGTNTGALIGMGNSLLRNANASGNITIKTGNLAISSSSTTSTGTVALLGSRGYSSANSAIAVTATGNVSLVAGNYGNALIGQGSYGTAAGNINVAAAGALSLNANGTSSQARVGNSGVNGSGNIAITASALSIAKTSGATSLIGGSATGGALTGNVIVHASTVQGIGDSIANDIVGGDFALYAQGSGTVDLGSVGTYSSSHNLYVSSAGNLLLSGSVQNAGAGNITLVAAKTVTVGGASASGNVAVGSRSGTTEIDGTDILLSATNGYAQIGYHGGGSGAINVLSSGTIALNGGASTGYYAQIGDGGYGVSGSSSAPISVSATTDISLIGGAGQEAYAQIGNGGAESNSSTGGYSETGDIAVINSGAMTLQAGAGKGSYVQIGNGGYLSGQSLNGTATIGGNISVITYSALNLAGGGDDAYVQIGNGGDLVNNNAANGSNGTITGDIAVAVQAPNVPGQDQLVLTAGTGANSYAQIGNGGQGENTPAAGATVDFTISGNVTVADLTLTGSNTGTNGYAQVGNGDASHTGTGDVSGGVTLAQGTKLTYVPGKAPGASASFGNATGDGTTSGTVASSGTNAGTQGSVASITQTTTNNPTSFSLTTVSTTPSNIQQLASIDTVNNTEGPSPLEQLSDNSEKETASDSVADSVGKSLGEGKTINVSSTTLIPGLLKQIVTLTPNQPHGVPPADVDYSSWGNEALWRW